MRYRLTLAIAVLATALVAALAPGAGAATNTKVTIEPNAQLIMVANAVVVGVHYECAGGTGFVFVTLTQAPPETWAPTSGTGGSLVACDGKTHEAAVAVIGGPVGFDAGKAQATATLTAPSGTATDERTINLVVT